MRLIIREYLSMLKESGEIDSLLPDLLLAMNIKSINRPQRGVRQYGVDLIARGTEPGGTQETLFLFVVKQKDIDRNSWDTGPQSVRQTLNDILDIYIPSMIDEAHRKLPLKIVLCTNGDMKQEVSMNWISYTKKHSTPDKLEFQFWGGDQLAGYITEYLLDENLFPSIVQVHMRKTLAFLEVIEYDLSHFRSLVNLLLFDGSFSKKREKLKAIRCLHLCLNILFHWSLDVGNLKHAVHAGEYVSLRAWDMLTRHDGFADKDLASEFYKLEATRMEIGRAYVEKIMPHCLVRDGLARYGSDELEYPLLVFEQIGLLATVGLDYIFAAESIGEDRPNSHLRLWATKCAVAIQGLVQNNKVSNWPLFDSHINDICFAFLLLLKVNKQRVIVEWIDSLLLYLIRGYQLLNKFPILSDSYDELIDIELGNRSEVNSSTLLTVLLEFLAVLNLEQLYDASAPIIREVFEKVDLQLWFPDKNTETALYSSNALYTSGTMLTSIQLPTRLAEFKEQIIRQSNMEDPQLFSFQSADYPIVGIIAFRHFRTPVFPYFWRQLIEVNPSNRT